MQDFTGVPAVVDLAAMRDAMAALGGDPQKINPLVPVDLVIDHSVMVDYFGTAGAFQTNVELEYERNGERYEFLRWGAGAFDNFRVVPPGTGICHQVNLEYLAQTVWTEKTADGEKLAYPDTLVGTDSHTTMVNGLAVLGWGVGGIEAEAAMLGQPISMLIPEVIGFRLTGTAQGRRHRDRPRAHRHADAAQEGRGRQVRRVLRRRASTICRSRTARPSPTWRRNMARPAASSRSTQETLAYLEATGRDARAHRAGRGLCARRRACGATPTRPTRCSPTRWRSTSPRSSRRSPGRSGRRTACRWRDAAADFADGARQGIWQGRRARPRACRSKGRNFDLGHGDVVIAAITSCTNTSNP